MVHAINAVCLFVASLLHNWRLCRGRHCRTASSRDIVVCWWLRAWNTNISLLWQPVIL